ncbi:MAG: polyketide cyclase [Anaerolineales bacterium]|nr:MAG: polyketide cyclase [Anaerolineales bacterium]
MTNRDSIQAQKERAVDFLQLVVAGNIDEAYQTYVNMHGKHHNMYYSADLNSLKEGMLENHAQFPNKRIMVKNVLGENNLVAVHSNIILKPGEPGMAVVHIFRFEQGKIVEMWDVGQTIPLESPNRIGAF